MGTVSIKPKSNSVEKKGTGKTNLKSTNTTASSNKTNITNKTVNKTNVKQSIDFNSKVNRSAIVK